ncbi:MAG: hypothetical protein WCG95_06830 [bacterium]
MKCQFCDFETAQDFRICPACSKKVSTPENSAPRDSNVGLTLGMLLIVIGLGFLIVGFNYDISVSSFSGGVVNLEKLHISLSYEIFGGASLVTGSICCAASFISSLIKRK